MAQERIETFETNSWETSFSPDEQQRAIEALESGKVLYFPSLAFPLSSDELSLLSPDKMSPKAKNISYDLRFDILGGVNCSESEKAHMKEMIRRFAKKSRALVDLLFPHYQASLNQQKTSFRPVEIFGRKSSYRKDDTRLHVDSFPSNPVKGERILRFFTNINHQGKPRVWRLGEPFADVLNTIAPRVSSPIPGLAHLLKLLRITKSLRTPYDHYMLQIHDEMKRDMVYQKEVSQEEIQFLPGSSWAVYTDLVSHAAMSGQHVLEQTFSLPAKAMKYPERSPLGLLESYFEKQLV